MSLSRSRALKLVARDVARGLRSKPTAEESLLWKALRNRKLFGRKFLRQHQILAEFGDKETFFVADFYCAEEKLIVEVDGEIHDAQACQDAMRDEVLRNLGYRVLRIRNEDVAPEMDRALIVIVGPFERTHPLTPPLFHPKERGTGGELGNKHD